MRKAIRRLLLTALLAILGTGLAWAQYTGTFTATGNMTTPRFLHTSTLLPNGKVLIAGGDSSYGRGLVAEATAELYDPSTGTFTATGNMITSRDGQTATLLPDGKVLIAGGGPRSNGVGYSLAAAELYDPNTGSFSATGDMTVERWGHTATLLNNGKVLIAGGIQRPVGSAIPDARILASAELYDPSTGTFTATGDMTSGFADTATLLPNGKVLIVRGAPEDNPLFLAELYDPSTGTFTGVGRTITNHTGPTAALLTNGQVLVAGGDIGDGDGPSNKAELYDPSNGAFSAAGNLTTGREQDTTTLLPDGTVLFAGGHNGGVRLPDGGSDNASSAELYNPVLGIFSATGGMATGRDIHTATLLNNGKVLITGGNEYYPFGAGGRDPLHPVLASAELYNPPVLVPAPVLFSLSGDGKGQGAILHNSTHQVASSDNPAAAGEALEIYCTGLSDGSLIPPQIAIGGRMAEVLFFGKAPGFAGVNQVNVRVPSNVAPGPAVPVRLIYIGRPSNEVTIGVR